MSISIQVSKELNEDLKSFNIKNFLSKYSTNDIKDCFSQLDIHIKCSLLLYLSQLSDSDISQYNDLFNSLIEQALLDKDQWVSFSGSYLKSIQMKSIFQCEDQPLWNESIQNIKNKTKTRNTSTIIYTDYLPLYYDQKYKHMNESLQTLNCVPITKREKTSPILKNILTKKLSNRQEKQIPAIISKINVPSKPIIEKKTKPVDKESTIIKKKKMKPVLAVLQNKNINIPSSTVPTEKKDEITANIKNLLKNILPINQPKFFSNINTSSINPSDNISNIIYYPPPYMTHEAFLKKQFSVLSLSDLDPLLVAFFDRKKPDNLEFNDYEFILSENWMETGDNEWQGNIQILLIHFDTYKWEIVHKVVQAN
ncbi:hypothetical protein WA158_007683 [Blastocystis sp. Blastoise]